MLEEKIGTPFGFCVSSLSTLAPSFLAGIFLNKQVREVAAGFRT
jgi:hypothetical protein